MHLCLNMLDVHWHGRGWRLGMYLVLESHALCVASLQYVSMFEYGGYAQAWTMQAPWSMPCAGAVCIICREFAECADVSICWFCTFDYAGCAWAWTSHAPKYMPSRDFPGTGFWNGASALKQYFVLPKNGSKYYLKCTFLVFPVLGILGLDTPLVPSVHHVCCGHSCCCCCCC